jgi:hypothetical protein
MKMPDAELEALARKDVMERAKIAGAQMMQQSATAAPPAPAAAVQPAQTPQQPPSKPAGDPLEKARAAIAAGVPREEVIERLHQSGIDPTGL